MNGVKAYVREKLIILDFYLVFKDFWFGIWYEIPCSIVWFEKLPKRLEVEGNIFKVNVVVNHHLRLILAKNWEENKDLNHVRKRENLTKRGGRKNRWDSSNGHGYKNHILHPNSCLFYDILSANELINNESSFTFRAFLLPIRVNFAWIASRILAPHHNYLNTVSDCASLIWKRHWIIHRDWVRFVGVEFINWLKITCCQRGWYLSIPRNWAKLWIKCEVIERTCRFIPKRLVEDVIILERHSYRACRSCCETIKNWCDRTVKILKQFIRDVDKFICGARIDAPNKRL